MFEAHRPMFHSTLVSRIVKKKKRGVPGHESLDGLERNEAHPRPGTPIDIDRYRYR